MDTQELLREQWLRAQARLRDRGLLKGDASLSLRIPGADAMWFGAAGDAAPRRVQRLCTPAAKLHAAVYGARPDIGAIAVGGGDYGACIADFGGALPQVFDEQARHLGRMGPAAAGPAEAARSLRTGGNALLVGGRPVCLGMTAARMALNAELFEKCAKAFVLACATGARIEPLPWIVRIMANRRLAKDERRATERFARGLLPEESKGY